MYVKEKVFIPNYSGEGNFLEETTIDGLLTQKNFDLFLPERGVLIYDSFNNPFFPFKEISYDTYKFEYWKYLRFLEKNVFGSKLMYAPFHFFIEFVKQNYIVINTRPLSLKAPDIPNLKKIKKDNKNLYDLYFNTWHICLLGDYKNNLPDIFLKKMLNGFLKSLYQILNKHGKIKNRNEFIHCVNTGCSKLIDESEFRVREEK